MLSGRATRSPAASEPHRVDAEGHGGATQTKTTALNASAAPFGTQPGHQAPFGGQGVRQRPATAPAISIDANANAPGTQPQRSASFGALRTASSVSGRAERLVVAALLLLAGLVGVLTFYAPDSRMPTRYRTMDDEVTDKPWTGAARRSKRDVAFGGHFPPLSLRHETAHGQGRVHVPDQKARAREDIGDAAVERMEELERRAARAMAEASAPSSPRAQQRRSGDPCSPTAVVSHSDAHERVGHCEQHGVHVAAHCPEVCFEVAAAAIATAEATEEAVDGAMVVEAMTRAKSNVATCADFDMARCFASVSKHSCLSQDSDTSHEWFGVSEMSLMCPRVCSWLLLQDGYAFAQSYWQSHSCHISAADTTKTVSLKAFTSEVKSALSGVLGHVAKGVSEEVKKSSEDRRLAEGLVGGWTVRRDSRTDRTFYYNRDSKKGQYDRPTEEGTQPETTPEAWQKAESLMREARLTQFGVVEGKSLREKLESVMKIEAAERL